MQIVLQSCRILQAVLEAVNPLQITHRDKKPLHTLCKEVYKHYLDAVLMGKGYDWSSYGVHMIFFAISSFINIARSHDASVSVVKTFASLI